MQKLYGEYLTHVRCLDALRAQMNVNAKVAQPASEDGRKTSAPASMILLPDGILDLSDELSNDGDDLLEEDANELKLKRLSEANADGSDNKADKPVDGQTSRAKLRIKTGGNLIRMKYLVSIHWTNVSKSQFVKRPMSDSLAACWERMVNQTLIALSNSFILLKEETLMIRR